jgi:hypothetical protein
VSIEYLEGDNIGKKYRVKMKVSVGKKGYGIEFENGKSLENNGNKKRDISYISHFKCVKVQDLLYKNELDVIYYKVLKVSLGGEIIEYTTIKRVIYC